MFDFETKESVLIHCNIVNNDYHDYQHVSKVLYTCVANKAFDQLLHTPPQSFIFSEAFIQKFFISELRM